MTRQAEQLAYDLFRDHVEVALREAGAAVHVASFSTTDRLTIMGDDEEPVTARQVARAAHVLGELGYEYHSAGSKAATFNGTPTPPAAYSNAPRCVHGWSERTCPYERHCPER